ncbi:MAG: DUF6314 family protein [Marinovum sp.]|nr:DUF6314 family protein [Marinovum sp.]
MTRPKELDDFLGFWQITREIVDRASHQIGCFDGTAMFASDLRGLVYREDGILTLGAVASMRATRCYVWQTDGPSIAVFFDDGRAFHTFSLNQALPMASHFCAPDTYEVTYDFSRWPNWSSNWKVTGPRKDYSMRSHYIRAVVDTGT